MSRALVATVWGMCLLLALEFVPKRSSVQPARTTMSRVDVLADDRGLQGCLSMADVKPDWAKDFLAKHQVATLDDSVYAVSHDTWEKGVEALVGQVPTLKDNMIALARFRSAFDIGREALRQAAAPAAKSSDLDEPLPEATLKSLNQDWVRRYNLQLDPSMEPSEALRSRLYRELRKGQLTVIEARGVKSVIAIAQPRTQGSVTLGDNLHLELKKRRVSPSRAVWSTTSSCEFWPTPSLGQVITRLTMKEVAVG